VAVEAELARLRAENARLLKLLRLTPQQAAAPGPAQGAFFEAAPGIVHHRSPQDAKVAFFGALFAARTDVYAVRYDNARTGKGGWIPAVRGGWRKGVRHEDRNYLPLTPAVLAAHLKGEAHIGLYPLLDGDRCWWLAADFDGPEAMFDALMYVKAGRALQVPVALEVSRSGVGAHAWVFFTAPVPAELARRLGTGLLREAMALRGRMTLASYDRLFPSQDLLPVGGIGNLIAAPLFKPGHDPVILRGGMGAKTRAAAIARLTRQPGGPPLLAVATGPYAGEGFDCPPLDTLFLTAPVANKGSLLQYAGRILRPYDGKATAEVHDYHDELTGVLASSLAKRAPGYTSLGFPDPRKLPYTPSADTARSTQPGVLPS